MRKFSVLLIASCITATISCKKEVSTEVSTNATQSQSLQAMSQDNATAGGIGWGVWPHQSTTAKCINVANSIGVNYVRTAIIVSDFNGRDGKLEEYVSKGLKPVVNLTWNRHGDWPKDMNQYKNSLGKVLAKYASKIEVAVIENEPTTDGFHKGSIDDYINELKNAVSVCKQHGVKVTDGAIHIANILLVKDGKINANKNTPKVKKLIDAYKGIDLDYVNIHTAGFGNSYPLNDFKDCADYLRNQTGHPVMSNEWHTESNSSSLMKDMVAGWKAGDYKIAICNDGKYPLYKDSKLTSVGQDYKSAIH